jgi:hypothetical protein
VSVSGIATNATCFGEADGSIAVTNSATVVITNANNDVVATGLVAGTYTLTATATGGNEGQNCIATAQVTITQPEIQSLLAVSLQMLLVLVKLMVDCCNQQ